MKGTDRYRVSGVTCQMGDHTLPVVNLSVSGFFVECPTPPPNGSSIEVRLGLPDAAPAAVVGEIAWINDREKPRQASLPAGFGFRIRRISFQDKMAVLRFLRGTDPAALRDR